MKDLSKKRNGMIDLWRDKTLNDKEFADKNKELNLQISNIKTMFDQMYANLTMLENEINNLLSKIDKERELQN